MWGESALRSVLSCASVDLSRLREVMEASNGD
jgi:hypothetical protein